MNRLSGPGGERAALLAGGNDGGIKRQCPKIAAGRGTAGPGKGIPSKLAAASAGATARG